LSTKQEQNLKKYGHLPEKEAEAIPWDKMSWAGLKVIITTDSTEAQIIADSMQDGMSCRLAWHLVNEHRYQQDLESLTFSAVYSVIARLMPKVKKVKHLKQGSNDKMSHWAISRSRCITQLTISFEKITMTADNFPDKVLPDCFNSNKVRKYQTIGTLWVDEAHKVTVPGGDNTICGSCKEIL
jgi:hypothetical protein